MKHPICTIALTTATLAVSTYVADEYTSANIGIYANINRIVSQASFTGQDSISIDCQKYLNSVMIRKSFDDSMRERQISDTPLYVKQALLDMSEKCSAFGIKDVYADYSPVTNAIRIDLAIDDDFLLIVRKTFGEDDNGVAVSLFKGDEEFLADYFDMSQFVNEVNSCIRG